MLYRTIAVPKCSPTDATDELSLGKKAYNVCSMSKLGDCGPNQACVQQSATADPDLGTCECLPGYSLQSDNVRKTFYIIF